MKKSILFTCMMVAAIILSSTAIAQKRKKKTEEVPPVPQPVVVVVPPAPMFQNRMDTISYILGADIAKSFTKNEMKINQDKLFKGYSDGMAQKDTILFKAAQVAEIMKAYQEEMMKVFQAKSEIEMKKAKEASATFFAANKTKEGVLELPSGVQYKILKDGTGAFPKETDKVTVHYKGTLLDGKVFDSSIGGEPVTFPLNQVIKGWTEGMQKCKLGGKIQLFIPSDLAYGDKPQSSIPGGSALIFEVELLNIEAAAPEVAPEATNVKATPVKKATVKSSSKASTTKTTAKPAAKTIKPAVKTAVKK